MSTTAKILIGVGSGCLLIIILVVVAGYLFVSRVITPTIRNTVQAPPELSTPRVIQGADAIAKNEALSDSRLGSVSDIHLGTFDPNAGNGIAVAGSAGALFLSSDLKPKAYVSFGGSSSTGYPGYSGMSSRIRIVEVDGDNSCEFLSSEGTWAHEFKVLDHNANTLWSYSSSGRNSGIDSISPGDIDGDGMMEFAVGFNGNDGLRLVDSKGSERWQQSGGNIWHVEIADIDGKGKPRIIHSDAAGQLTVRDAKGEFVRSLGTGVSGRQVSFSTITAKFTVCRWPKTNSPERVVVPSGSNLTILDEKGVQIASFTEPTLGMMTEVAAIPVQLKAGKPAYLATLVTSQMWDRTALSIFTAKGTCIYREALPCSTTALAVLPTAKNGAEALLVGGENRMWKYTAKK